MVPRTISSYSTCALVVISPATTATPVVTSVSQATRPLGSCFITSSRTASEIWSAILSGWPSVTDSDVNRKLRKASLKLILLRDLRGTPRCKRPRPFGTLLNLTKLPFARRRINGLIPSSLPVRRTVEIRLRTASCRIDRRALCHVRVVVRLDLEPSLCLLGHQVGADERIQITVHHAVDIAHLELRAVVLDQAVRLHHIGPDLAAEGNVQ